MQRIVFLDFLRAIAVLLVLWGHVFLVGINDPVTVGVWVPMVKGLMFGPDTVANNPHGQLGLVLAIRLGISSGALGVGIFFLISGYIIQRTLDRMSPESFLLRRFFRIFPTCAVAVVFVAGVTAAICAAIDEPQPNSLSSMLTSAFALNYFNGAFATIPVLWTLTVEVAFYAVMGIAVLVVGRRLEIGDLLFVALCCLLCISLMGNSYFLALNPVLRDKLTYIISLLVHVNFMLVGSILYRGMSDKRWLAALVGMVAVSGSYVVSFVLYKEFTSGRDIGISMSDAVAAFVIFVLAMAIPMAGRWLKPFQWIAQVSYPVYLLHVPIGWFLIALGAELGLGINGSGILATVVVFLLSWGLHVYVEEPSQDLGRWLSRRIFASRANECGGARESANVGVKA